MNPANYSVISFPFLGLEVNPPRYFSIGSLDIHLYGVVIALGLFLAVLYAQKRCTSVGITPDDLMDGVLWITPFAIVCARIYYCAFTWESYRDDPISVLYIWNGGIAIYGAVIGAVIGVLIFCKIKKVNVFGILDSVRGQMGQFLQPGGLRRCHGQLFPHGAVQHRHRGV